MVERTISQNLTVCGGGAHSFYQDSAKLATQLMYVKIAQTHTGLLQKYSTLC